MMAFGGAAMKALENGEGGTCGDNVWTSAREEVVLPSWKIRRS